MSTPDINLSSQPINATPPKPIGGVNYLRPSGEASGRRTIINYDMSNTAATKQQYRIPNMQSVAIKFAAFRGGRDISRVTVTFPAPGEYPPTGFQLAVSELPGDFTTSQGEGCVIYSPRPSAQITFGGACSLDPNKEYYLNVRFVDPATGASTCKTAHCGAYSNLNY